MNTQNNQPSGASHCSQSWIVNGVGKIMELEYAIGDVARLYEPNPGGVAIAKKGNTIQLGYEALKRWHRKDRDRTAPYVRAWNSLPIE